MSVQIPLNPAILKWARERQGLTLQEVATRFKKDVPEIELWETGGQSPTYVQLEKLAYEVYKRPIAIFFFPEPPQEQSLEKSFRTLPETEITKISPRLRVLIRSAKALQLGLYELFENSENGISNLVNRVGNSEITRLSVFVNKVREALGVSLENQISWRDQDIALKNWRTALEANGIFVFKGAFYDDNFSGFCLHDKVFPLIYLNNSLSTTRQIFTIFHELAHLLLGLSGIEPKSDRYISLLKGESKDVEVFCNRFANALLVPDVDFNNEIKLKKPSERVFYELALKYKVSREVILRKFLDRGMLEEGQYDYFVKKWKDKVAEDKDKKKAKAGGNYYNTQGVYISERYANIIFNKYHQNVISLPDVASFLGVKIKSVERIEDSFLNRNK